MFLLKCLFLNLLLLQSTQVFANKALERVTGADTSRTGYYNPNPEDGRIPGQTDIILEEFSKRPSSKDTANPTQKKQMVQAIVRTATIHSRYKDAVYQQPINDRERNHFLCMQIIRNVSNCLIGQVKHISYWNDESVFKGIIEGLITPKNQNDLAELERLSKISQGEFTDWFVEAVCLLKDGLNKPTAWHWHDHDHEESLARASSTGGLKQAGAGGSLGASEDGNGHWSVPQLKAAAVAHGTITDQLGNQLPLDGEQGVYTVFKNSQELISEGVIDKQDVKVNIQRLLQDELKSRLTYQPNFSDSEYLNDLYHKLSAIYEAEKKAEKRPVVAGGARAPFFATASLAHEKADPAALHQVAAGGGMVVPQTITHLIAAISVTPNNQKDVMNAMNRNTNPQLKACLDAIEKLSAAQKPDAYQALRRKIESVVPEGQDRLLSIFNNSKRALIAFIDNAMQEAEEGPKRGDVDPAPALLVSAPIVDTAENLWGIMMENDRTASAAYENRLKNFFVNHWATNYRIGALPAADSQAVQAALQSKFDEINRRFPDDLSERKKGKVNLVENVLHACLEQGQGRALSRQNMLHLIQNAGESHVYTNMEKIRELPSVDWDSALRNHVFSDQRFTRQLGENDSVYWRRIGSILVQIYNQKIRQHVYNDGLRDDLDAGRAGALVPFNMMFDDGEDAKNAINYQLRDGADDIYAENERIRTININERGLSQEDIGKLLDSYRRTDQFVQKNLQQLFGLHVVASGVVSPFYADTSEFTLERIELCKKALLVFAYFDRPGDNYNDDLALLAMLIGRLTHCPDGIKTGIENVGRSALSGFSGVAAQGLGARDFDTYLKQDILKGFKNNTITALAAHNHSENVSITTEIKHKLQRFWNMPTNDRVENAHYVETDYAVTGYEPQLAYPSTIDLVAQHFYQHIYAGPHELVNTIYKYLLADNIDRPREAVHKRANFKGLVCNMLARHRPFSDFAADLDYITLVEQRYCENIALAGRPADYMFTRRGIETILFYAGYLAWGGLADEHPLIADWQEDLRWLRAHDANAYNRIYAR